MSIFFEKISDFVTGNGGQNFVWGILDVQIALKSQALYEKKMARLNRYPEKIFSMV